MWRIQSYDDKKKKLTCVVNRAFDSTYSAPSLSPLSVAETNLSLRERVCSKSVGFAPSSRGPLCSSGHHRASPRVGGARGK